jgi:hypothetical protein
MGHPLPFGPGNVGMFSSSRILPITVMHMLLPASHFRTLRKRALRYRPSQCSEAEIRGFLVQRYWQLTGDPAPPCTPAAH